MSWVQFTNKTGEIVAVRASKVDRVITEFDPEVGVTLTRVWTQEDGYRDSLLVTESLNAIVERLNAAERA